MRYRSLNTGSLSGCMFCPEHNADGGDTGEAYPPTFSITCRRAKRQTKGQSAASSAAYGCCDRRDKLDDKDIEQPQHHANPRARWS